MTKHHLTLTDNTETNVYMVQLDNDTHETFNTFDEAHTFVLGVLYGIGGKWQKSAKHENEYIYKECWEYIG